MLGVHEVAGLSFLTTKVFARNPDGEARAWCHTVDSKIRWQFCDVLNMRLQVPTVILRRVDMKTFSSLIAEEMFLSQKVD